jgi:hypothetical protein
MLSTVLLTPSTVGCDTPGFLKFLAHDRMTVSDALTHPFLDEDDKEPHGEHESDGHHHEVSLIVFYSILCRWQDIRQLQARTRRRACTF